MGELHVDPQVQLFLSKPALCKILGFSAFTGHWLTSHPATGACWVLDSTQQDQFQCLLSFVSAQERLLHCRVAARDPFELSYPAHLFIILLGSDLAAGNADAFSGRLWLDPSRGQAAFKVCFPMGHTSGKVTVTEGGNPIQLTLDCSTAVHGIC